MGNLHLPPIPNFNTKVFKFVISSLSFVIFIGWEEEAKGKEEVELFRGRSLWKQSSGSRAQSRLTARQQTTHIDLKFERGKTPASNTSSALKATIKTACHPAGDVMHVCPITVIFFLLFLTTLP